MRPTLERPKKAGLATTRPTRRCCWPRRSARRRARSPSGWPGSCPGGWATRVERVEVAGPGFLNVFLAEDWFVAALEDLLAAGDGFGAGTPDTRREGADRVRVRQPDRPADGPPSGRHAAFGDALARILELAGHSVSREYYFNDGGSQIDRLGESIRARARGEDLPEDGYQGDYVDALARDIEGAADRDPRELAPAGVESIMAGIRATLAAYRVEFDGWFLERSLHEGQIRAPSSARWRCSRSTATPTAPRARCGCARPRSATTRTAC